MGVKAGKAYESEVKIAKEIKEGGIELNGEYFIGDKAYTKSKASYKMKETLKNNFMVIKIILVFQIFKEIIIKLL